MKRVFCDGCGQQITFNDKNEPVRDARVNMRVNFYCIDNAGSELGQLASDPLDLCRGCIERMRSLIDPRKWSRAENLDGPPGPKPPPERVPLRVG